MSPRRPIFSSSVRSSRRRAGFTLLEILLSLALVALMLVALNTFVFSMGELWGKNTDIRLFEQHVRAVTRALDRELRAATLPPSARANASPVAPQEIRPGGGVTDTLLTFELPAGAAYGERNASMEQWVALKLLRELGDPQERYAAGDVVQFPTPDGQGSYAGAVLQVRDAAEGGAVLFDFNHPLAGQPVSFEVQLIGVL